MCAHSSLLLVCSLLLASVLIFLAHFAPVSDQALSLLPVFKLAPLSVLPAKIEHSHFITYNKTLDTLANSNAV